MDNLIEMKNMVKVFPPNVVALDQVSVAFRQGEIHAIVGENGAGKSTLMKVLYGLEHPDAGEILYRGRPVAFRNPGEAIAQGIGMVHQEILLVNEYTVWENVVLGVEPTGPFGRIDARKARQQVADKIAEFEFNLDPDALVRDISVAARQKVEILKLLYRAVSVLILDEPTAVLTPQEIPQLFGELRRLRDNGHTILFISHHLEEVLDLSDRITVMRRGKKIDTVDARATSKADLARMMVGREVLFTTEKNEKAPGAVALQIENLGLTEAATRRVLLKDINLTLRAGEIVGIAGVEGNGQFELVNAVMGLVQPTQGRITAGGVDLTHAPVLERRQSISFVPQDRGKMGASLPASVTENAIMTHHRLNARITRWKGLLLDGRAAREFSEELRQNFSVSMSAVTQPFRSLSGGNQQKVILGRELMLHSPVVLLDQPTRGLDVGSIEYVHQLILDMRDDGRAILLISADLDELFRLADRIVVLYRGTVAADLPTRQTTVEEVGYLMLEGTANPQESPRSGQDDA
ncbi:MAG TPA: ABC transporter ATP-binding protein [Anaerolineaceae bacterium]|nr:ABC transporter ATP-binding protein [Anaerolineaceae bacterium]